MSPIVSKGAGGKGGSAKSSGKADSKGKGQAKGEKGKAAGKTNGKDQKSDTKNTEYGPQYKGKPTDEHPPYDPAVFSGPPSSYLSDAQQKRILTRINKEYRRNTKSSGELSKNTGGGGRLRPGPSALEKKLLSVKVNKDDVDDTIREYNALVKYLGPLRKPVKDKVSGTRNVGDMIQRTMENIPTMAKFLYRSTFGYLIAKAQDYRTLRRLKKDPKGTVVTFIAQGRANNIGVGSGIGTSEMEQGRNPLHVKMYYKEGIPEAAKRFVEEVLKAYKKAGITDPRYRTDVARGHSSGADAIRYAATMKEILDTGIVAGQGTAGLPYGMDEETIGVKLIKGVVDLSHEDTKTSKVARQAAIRSYTHKPLIHYETVAGGRDDLVRAEYAVDLGAEQIHILPNETHFSSSGVEPHVNRATSELLSKQRTRAIATRGSNYHRKAPSEYKSAA